MNRPYTVCHIFSALDGAITGNFMRLEECGSALQNYGRLRSYFECPAILYGTTTMLDFCNGFVKELSETGLKDRRDFVSPEASGKYIIAIDRNGKLAYGNDYIDRHGERYHIIEVLTQKVSDGYLGYLQKLGISYIFAGQSDIDCKIAMSKLYQIFGIKKLLIAGGGYINWAFADAGMIDELSLVLAPAADGEDKVTVFERTEKSINRALAFTLTDVQKLEGNSVWLRYKFNNAKE